MRQENSGEIASNLEELEQRYAALFKHSPFAVALTRMPEGTTVAVNDAFLTLFEFAREEVLGKTSFELGISDGESRQEVAQTLEHHGAVRGFECSRATKSGRALYLTLSLDWVELGTEKYILTIIQDITERKRAQEALRKSEERYRSLFDNMSEMFQILQPMFNEQGACIDFRYIRVNRATEALVGKTREEIEGKTALQLFGFVEQYWFEMLARVLKTGEAEHLSNYSKAMDLYYDVHAWKTDEGQVAIVFSNITDHMRAESALRERTEQLQTLLDTTPIPVFIAHDPDCRKITGNTAAQELIQLPPEKNISKSAPASERPTSWQEMRDGIPIPPEELPLQQAARGKEIRGYEMDLVFTDGRIKSVVANASPIRDKDGKPAGGVAILMDITERKRAADALRASELNMRLMVDMASDAMMVVSSNGVIEAVSAPGMRILGYEEEELVGRTVAEFAETFSRLDTILAIEDLRRKAPTPITSTLRVRTKKGNLVWLGITASFVSLGTHSEKYFVKFYQVELPAGNNLTGSGRKGFEAPNNLNGR